MSSTRSPAEYGWQGRPHDFIGFDEGAPLDERKVRFVMGWRRSENPLQLPRGDRLRSQAVKATLRLLGAESPDRVIASARRQ